MNLVEAKKLAMQATALEQTIKNAIAQLGDEDAVTVMSHAVVNILHERGLDAKRFQKEIEPATTILTICDREG